MPDPSASSGRDWTRHIRSHLASLRLSPARERDIAEELTQHLADRWGELVARGTGRSTLSVLKC